MTDQAASQSGLYAFAECEAVDMQNGAVLLIDRHGDSQLMVAAPVAQSMQLCRAFRTLEQHANVLATSIPELQGQQADVMNVLNMLRDAGLMISAESVADRLNAPVDPPLDMPATRIFIITCDRPAAIRRLLDSMLRAGNLSHHEALFLIDDSRDEDNARQNREAVEEFNFTSPREMNYVGAAAAQRLLDNLIDAAPAQKQAIRFLIDREHWAGDKTYGLARNLCLLLSMGRRAVILDDDVICAAVAAPHKKPGVHFGHTPREVEFYADEQEMLGRTAREDFDPLTGHARCLGLNIGQAIGKLNGKPIAAEELAGANAAYLSLWSATSPVLVTQSGTVGDPGTPGTEWIYSVERESALRLQAFAGGVEGALASRHYWMGQPRPLFTKMSVISQVTGLDNTQLLPPYFPAHRGEDYLFGAMTEFLHPEAAVLDYDWCVPHLPLDARPREPSPPPQSGKGKLNINKYVTDRTRYDRGISAEARLASLAALAGELAQTSDRSLMTLYRREIAEGQAADLSRLSALLNDGTVRSPAWKDWLQQSANNIAQTMQAPADLADFQQGVAPESLIALLRRYSAGFSGALSAWPELRRVAPAVTSAMLDKGEFSAL